MESQDFAERIIGWYHHHKRDLPWRHSRDPYIIWLSEIILQQTRVVQGLPYFMRFAEAFPTVYDLASASQQEVLRLWQGLGYYSRARNMHACARLIVEQHNGVFPLHYQELLQLKGVGPYTAAAIASFAYNETVAVLDGNVFRVLARVFGVEDDISSGQGQKRFQALAAQLVPEGKAGEYNQAIMEFGALQCTPQSPACLLCPLSEICYAFHHNAQKRLPVKIKKVKIRKRYFSYLLIRKDKQIYMKERGPGDIWQGLYDFHLLESRRAVDDVDDLPEDELLSAIIEQANPQIEVSDVYRHVLTHQQLQLRFFLIDVSKGRLADSLWAKNQLRPYTVDEVKELPKPILIDKYLSEVIF
ncbi:MAG: A/G-specific adenine glycosylase [Cyclobacteriaceae bacterium]